MFRPESIIFGIASISPSNRLRSGLGIALVQSQRNVTYGYVNNAVPARG